MKNLYASVIAIAALLVFSSVAVAGPRLWEKKEDSPGRFKVLDKWNDEAVWDEKETGLLWQRSPSPSAFPWDVARAHCISSIVGGRKGWRLPSVAELASLVDPTQFNPALPPGHPFIGVESSAYWSASTSAGDPTFAWVVHFGDGSVGANGKNASFFVWCVRGPMNADQY